ncbi:MAG: PLP-dependent aminotransferase family protein [Parvibaculaceae bacterium]
MTNWIPTLAPDKPRYVAIADAIGADLTVGKLKAGDRLPPQRELAWKLGVTIGTVTRAYQEASKRGLLSGEVGRGSYLRDPRPNYAAAQSISNGVEAGLLDMQMSAPPRVAQAADFEGALRDIARDPGWIELLDYPSAQGFAPHRDAGAQWLGKCGIDIAAGQVVLSAGAQAALISAFSTITTPGERILIEPLTYPTMQPITRQFGLQMRTLQNDAEGVTPDSLEHYARRGEARLVYLVPTLQNPTTVTLSEERRRAIAEIARRYDLTIIEDDVFRLLGEDAPITIQSLAPERTYYITSLSKTVAPGLRMAFMAPPPGATEAINRQQMIIGGRPNALSAELARRWIDTGVADRALMAIRKELGLRRAAALEHLKGVPVACAPGSMFAWITLPRYWRPSDFAAAALAAGIKVTPGTAFAMDPSVQQNAIRACFGPAPSQQAVRDAFAKLRALIDKCPVEDCHTMA